MFTAVGNNFFVLETDISGLSGGLVVILFLCNLLYTYSIIYITICQVYITMMFQPQVDILMKTPILPTCNKMIV
jgi:hypothetical protein